MNDRKTQSHIDDILDAIQQIASGDFSTRAPMFNNEDDLNAIALGINMLGEEIEAKIHSQDRYLLEKNILLNVSHQVSTTFDLELILQTISDGTAQLLEIETAAIYLLEGQKIFLGASTPPLDSQMPETLRWAQLSDHPHIQKALSTQLPINIVNTKDATLSPAERVVVEMRQLVSLIYLPFQHEDNVAGVLILGTSSQPRDYSDHEMDICRTITNELTLGIVNANLFKKVNKYIEELKAQVAERKQAEEKIKQQSIQRQRLLEIGRELTSSLDIDKVLKDISAEVRTLLGCSGVTIYMLDKQGRMLIPVLSYDPPYEEQVMSAKLDVDNSLTGKVIKAKQGMVINYADQQPDKYHIPGTPIDEDHLIIAPFIINEKVVGSLNIYRKLATFNEEDLALVETFTMYASTAINNARTHQELLDQIAERKQAELQLKDALAEAQRFSEALDHVTSHVYMKDTQSRYIYANQLTLKLFGCSAEELVGSDDTRFFPPDTVKQLREIDSRVFLGEQTVEEIDVDDGEGNRTVFWEVKTPIYSDPENKTIWGLLGISTNITERKLAEAELAQSERDYRGLFDMAHDAIILFEEKGEIVVEANQRACDLYGYSREEFIGMSLINISTDLDLGKRRVKEVLEKGHIKQFEIIQKHKDGTSLYVEINASRTIYQGKSVILSLNHDITERKQAEEALAESDSLRELLLDVITHDLRNPISTIYSFSELFRADFPDNELAKHIHLGSERLLQVLDNTTTLAQATFGEDIPKEELSLNDMLTAIVNEFSNRMTEDKMDLRMEIPLDTMISANPLIAEVFKNYISNAIEYAAAGKRITINAQGDDESITVRVRDQGETIRSEDRENIFLRRFQLDTEVRRGRGLGLAIVKRIATAHNGEAWVEPNTPQGNSFCLRIPR